jgi:alpha-mannosidase
MKSMHLVCNAHLDPVWLWEWEEGAAEAVGTFRAAADFCEEFDNFVFNHNEAVLYRWIEEYEPPLFERIRKLVKLGKWHIMGGWYVQPDCNMPSGESFVRQALLGRTYFKEKFGVEPKTAINFDPFGHTRGLVQILAKCGYRAYVHSRPGQDDCPLANDRYVWEGYDGSRVIGTRSYEGYGSRFGHAREKIERLIDHTNDDPVHVILWGVGNHGGGPSRKDIRDVNKLIADRPDVRITHSSMDDYTAELVKHADKLPVHRGDLNLWAPGCYTSQVRIKQTHRRTENELFATEKMLCAAWSQGLLDYPADDLREAMRDLALCEFHDILPGSSIQPAEDASLRILDHGLEILSRLKARAFFALAAGQKKARDGEMPVLVYNPHPFAVRAVVECEFQPAGQNWDGAFTNVRVFQSGRELPTQVEKELSSIPIDWRKRVAFIAELAPGQMNRFDCRLEPLKGKPKIKLKERNGRIVFKTDDLRVVINTRTGLIDQYRVGGRDAVLPSACKPLVIADNFDPWGMTVTRFRKVAGSFRLLSKKKGSEFSGLQAVVPSVRVIEDGPARSVVEAVFGYGDSFICQRYKLPKRGTEIEVEVRVVWAEKDKMLKLSIPTPDRAAEYHGQVAYGTDRLRDDGTECVAQKWVAAVSKKAGLALSCINNGTYGSDFKDGELRLTLLRSPGYSSHPIDDRQVLPTDRFMPRSDQGERLFHFWLNAGPRGVRLAAVDREALARNEAPMALSFFPAGQGKALKPLATLSDGVVQITAIKKAEKGNAMIVRLFNPTGRTRTTTLALPCLRTRKKLTLGKYEIRTLKIGVKTRKWADVNLLEKRG